eukprot:TRINITY_DN107159_c0_g1_i1.p1 TRINITY_DN107159_c0_g1~~TRINITY_DN107159_c0_g1_i1.p1  ORF type:complete len:680 (-),score=121.35 TRINITY_DN107159_c0_g1_i1:12-2051(-)
MSKIHPEPEEEKPLKPEATALKRDSIEIAIDPAKRSRATWIIIIASFVDVACSIILQPNHPMMCSNAPLATKLDGVPSNYTHPQAFPGEGMPEYSWAVTIILVSNQLAQGVSNLIFGILSDKIGRKPCMVINLAMGALSMLCFWLAGNVIKNYWSYVAFMAFNGFGGAMKGIGQNYIQDINEPAEFRRLQPLIITAMTFGGVGGGLLGGVLNGAVRVDEYSGDLFAGAIVGLVAESISFMVVLLYCPKEPPKQKIAPMTKGDADAAGKADKASNRLRNILLLLVIAGGFDAFGDNGNTFARTVIFSNRYPAGKAPVWNTILLAVKCVGVFLAMMIVSRSAKKIKMPLWTVIGNVFSGACQLGVIPNSMPMSGFLAIWGTSQCFGFTSTMANLFLLPAFAPPETRGFWLGINQAVLLLCMAAAPLCLSAVYSAMSPPAGSPREAYADAELASMLSCGCISFFAAILYSNLLWMVPKPAPPPKLTVAKEDLEKYRNMTVKEFTRLGAEERDAVMKLMLKDGEAPPANSWIKYQEDLDDKELTQICVKAAADFSYIEKEIYNKMQDQTRMARDFELSKEDRDALDVRVDELAERSNMGNWIADYFNDAGYHSWSWFPNTYKAMIMNAFPPLNHLDGKKPSFQTMQEYQAFLLAFNRVMKRQVSMVSSAESVEGFKNMTIKTA